MKILLTTLNSKFIHSNLAVKYMHAMIRDRVDSVVEEFTINEDIEEILSRIMQGGYDMVAFSCYIWNIERTMKLAENIKKISPQTMILLGGPEVTYDADMVIKKNPFVDFVIAGEGEKAISDLADIMLQAEDSAGEISRAFGENSPYLEPLMNITNLYTAFAPCDMDFESRSLVITDLSIIPPVYLETKKQEIENKIVYYETSRGCTFSCAYCLSSTTKGVRFFDYDRVKAELTHLVSLGARQIKFVDRTFNSDESKALDMISFLMSLDDGSINFHFEITAHLLQRPVLDLIKTARRGLFQFEIGVQSTNDATLREVRRANRFEELSHNVLEIKSYGNVHQHLDLIAGLPYEDLQRFRKSFNDVFSLKPDALQLGFLKILKGSPMEKTVEKHGYSYRSYPPYEVLKNSYMSYADIDHLRSVENVLDRFYNTGRFRYSMEYLYDAVYCGRGYDLFEDLSAIIKDNDINTVRKEEEFRAMKLLGLSRSECDCMNTDFYVELLRLDYMNMGRNPSLPAFLASKNAREGESRLREFIFEFTRDQQNLVELGFAEDVHYKDAYKKINWSIFEYDMVQYISEIKKSGKTDIVKAVNVLIVNYDSGKDHNGDYRMLRRAYEI